MIEETGDLWDTPADVRVVLVCGGPGATEPTPPREEEEEEVRAEGANQGLVSYYGDWSLEAADHFPDLAGQVRYHRMNEGHLSVKLFMKMGNVPLVSYPISQTQLPTDAQVEASAIQLAAKMKGIKSFQRIVMPRPGCDGENPLNWTVVKLMLDPVLDDRFVVVNKLQINRGRVILPETASTGA